MLLRQVGPAGQAKLAAANVLLVGCGALGTVIAESLARAGVGHLTLCDRDIVETTNLQRQTLFTEADAQAGQSKAVAAVKRLKQVNSEIELQANAVDVDSGNLESLAEGKTLLLDGTDNAATRYLINDVSIKHGIPWIYGAAVATEGRVMPIVPESGPCLRCVFPSMPAAGELATCDTVGVLGPVAGVVANLQAALAIQILVSGEAPIKLHALDLWTGNVNAIDMTAAKNPDCPCCGRRDFGFLDTPPGDAVSLCGRQTIQIRPKNVTLDLDQVATRLGSLGTIKSLPHLLRFTPTDSKLTMSIFRDGRALIQGTDDASEARSVYSKYIGN